MKSTFPSVLLYTIALTAMALFFISHVASQSVFEGLALIVALIATALAVSLNPRTRDLTFTVSIVAAVAASLYYPGLFLQWGSFPTSKLIVPLLMIIMFGMGTAMSLSDFIGVIKMPKGVIIGILCQFTIMPVIGYTLASLSELPPAIAAGVILVGCSPSGLASNVMTYISGSNLALSLTLTAVATLLAPVMTPFLMRLLADQYVPIDFLAMLWSIVKIVIIPVAAGLVFNHFAHGKIKWLDRSMPRLSMLGIAVIITIITASGRDALLDIGLILIGVVIIHNLTGYLLGYAVGKIAGLDTTSARAVAFEVGMQNAGLASGIALEMGRVATMGLAPAIFGPFMNISGSSLASWWKGRPPNEKMVDQ